MKFFLSLLIYILVVTDVKAAGEIWMPYFFLQKTGEIENVVFNYTKNDIKTNVVKVGETYQYDDSQIDINVPTNASAIINMPINTTVFLDENSQLKIHTSLISIDNLDAAPSLAKVSNEMSVWSLTVGMCDVISSETNSTISLQTPRTTLTLKKGKYRIVVQGKTTVIAVLEGVALVHNTIESKTPVQITQGNFGHVSTYYSLSTKGMDVLNNGKATISIRQIQPDDVIKIKTNCDLMESLKKDVIFVIINKKIVGINIR